jgi:hypothetical protein
MNELVSFGIADTNVYIFCEKEMSSLALQQYKKYPPKDSNLQCIKIYIVFDEYRLKMNEYKNLYRGTTYFWGENKKNQELCFAFSTRFEKTDFFNTNRNVWYAIMSSKLDKVTLHINPDWLYNGELIDEICIRPWIQRLFIEKKANSKLMILHGGAAILQNKHIALLGDSGVGKSTMCNLLEQRGYTVLGDDRIAINFKGNNIYVNGTPWNTKNPQFSKNEEGKLQSIFFLKHGNQNEIKEVSPIDALNRIMKQVYQPLLYNRNEVIAHILPLCRFIGNNIPCYELKFIPTVDIVEYMETFGNDKNISFSK